MLLIVGTFRIPSERLVAARSAIEHMIGSSRAEAGCLEYGYAEDLLDPGLIHVKELWRSQAALDHHFASDHIANWRASWPLFGIHSRALAVYDVGEPRPT